MSDYLITTDNMTDLPDSYFQEHGLGVMSLTYMIDGKTYSKKNELPYKEFYAKMRAGSMPTTSQVNPDEAKEELKAFLERTNRLIHIAFSSGLSGSYNSARIAAEELMEENPDVKITVIDSLCASLGEGLLVHKAVMLKGMEYDELVSWIENNKLHMVHNFTVDDLFHLYRGGRVSKAAAILGTMVNHKPVLHVDDEGHLVPVSKVRGRKKSIAALVESMEKQIGSYRDKNDIVFIREKLGTQEFLINPVGPTIGAHSGPGTLALFYMGDVR